MNTTYSEKEILTVIETIIELGGENALNTKERFFEMLQNKLGETLPERKKKFIADLIETFDDN